MTTFEVDAVITVEAVSDEIAEDIVLESLKEADPGDRIKNVEVVHIMDTSTYGR